MQLVEWVLMRKLSYWLQGINLPKRVLKAAHSINYQFIWDDKKGMSWAHMILPKQEGGIELRDPILLAKATSIKIVYIIWSANLIWAI